MEDSGIDHIHFATPSLTPHVSETSASDYSDVECSYSQTDNLQIMPNTTKDLEEVINICCQLNDHECELDVQDQQPTEATDDSNDCSQIQTTTANNIYNSLHPQPSEDHHNDTLPVVQETESFEESFSSIVSDTDSIQIEQRHERQVLRYSPSLCVPYMDEKDEISKIKETLTTTATTNIPLEFTGLEKKDKNNLGHIMISYNHSTKLVCSKIAKSLKDRSYIVWIDQDNISGDILTSMASAVENSFVVLMAINEQYFQSRYCRLEAEYSVEQNKASIPMIMQTGYRALGWLGIINGAKLHIDFSQLPFEEAFNLLIREIEAVRISLGADQNDRNALIPVYNPMTTITTTTMDNSMFYTQNISEWTADDVMDWLYREKLEIFEDGLRYFTGITLSQLYKIKQESPSDFYRMADTLLPSTMPLRLVHNLRFYAALDSLFSSISHIHMHR